MLLTGLDSHFVIFCVTSPLIVPLMSLTVFFMNGLDLTGYLFRISSTDKASLDTNVTKFDLRFGLVA